MKRAHFDIIHPANVHYFKHVIANLKEKGVEIVITCRNKEVTYELLESEGFEYIKMGSNPQSKIGKALFLLKCEFKTLFLYLRKRPSISLSFGASYVAHNSFLLRVPHVSLDDTEHASFNRKLYLPFTDLVLNPESYSLDLGKKQFKFPGHMELFYLNEKYFTPDPSIYDDLGIVPSDRFIFIRFVSWGALHDEGQMGFTDEYKVQMIKELTKEYKVYISSEGELPEELLPYQIKIQPSRIHHVLFYAELFIGEGATMASECAAIGTPAIYVNSLNAGTLENQEELGLIHNLRFQTEVIELAKSILKNENIKLELKQKLKSLESERFNLTDFLTWLILNYPTSKKDLNRENLIAKF